jgi:ankyrin repeat protein
LSHFPHILSACTSCSCCLSALSQTDSNGATPLHVAAHCGNATAIDLLIACAKEHNMTQFVAATDGGGKSALWLAAAAGHADAVEALLKASSNTNFMSPNLFQSGFHLRLVKSSFISFILRSIRQTPTSTLQMRSRSVFFNIRAVLQTNPNVADRTYLPCVTCKKRLSTTNNGQAAEQNGHSTCAALLRQ